MMSQEVRFLRRPLHFPSLTSHLLLGQLDEQDAGVAFLCPASPNYSLPRPPEAASHTRTQNTNTDMQTGSKLPFNCIKMQIFEYTAFVWVSTRALSSPKL